VGWARGIGGFGASYKNAVKARYPAFVVMSPYGEMLPNPQSYIDLDETALDQFGIPTARRHLVWGENDRKIFVDMSRWATDILKASGAEILSVASEPAPNHELGGARMGNDPKRSVVNANCRTHDVNNLYVVDGSVFPSASEKNPTLTMMALAARTSDRIAESLKKRDM
jgi:choline dehydrogenase-like flavoprotein